MGVVVFAWQMFLKMDNVRSSPTQPSFIKRKNTVKCWRPFKRSSNTGWSRYAGLAYLYQANNPNRLGLIR